MSLKDDKQQNIQMELDFSSEPTGEAREVGRKEPESSGATSGPESPASTNWLMEEVCERENLKAALWQLQANKGSPGVNGMTVGGIKDYLKQHWPIIREQLLNGTYEPKPRRDLMAAKVFLRLTLLGPGGVPAAGHQCGRIPSLRSGHRRFKGIARSHPTLSLSAVTIIEGKKWASCSQNLIATIIRWPHHAQKPAHLGMVCYYLTN